jgi:hypothetical protein
MIAFEVYLNGKKICTAGGDELTSMTAAVSFFPKRYKRDNLNPALSVSGVVSRPEEFLEWAHRELETGDKVEIQVVDSLTSDKALRCHRPAHAR